MNKVFQVGSCDQLYQISTKIKLKAIYHDNINYVSKHNGNLFSRGRDTYNFLKNIQEIVINEVGLVIYSHDTSECFIYDHQRNG